MSQQKKLRAGRFFPALFFLIIFSFFTFAGTEYETLSGSNLTYTSNPMIITNELDSPITRTHDAFSPIVSDLNNDGVNEIVIFDIDGSNPTLWTAYAYEERTLTALDSITLNVSGSTVLSNFQVMDSDDDELKEIYYAHLTGSCVYRLEFNASDKFERGGQNCDGSFTSADVLMLECHDGQNICAIISAKQTFASAFGRLSTYNVTHTTPSGDTINLFNDGGIDDGMCMSNIKSFGFSDYNPNNGDYLEVVQSYLVIDGGTEVCFAVGTVHATNVSDLTLTTSKCRSVGSSVWTDTQPNCIADEYSYYISPPLVADINGFPSDGDEVIIAAPFSTSTFGMWSFKIDGTNVGSYGSISGVNGRYVSNPFLANAFTSSGYNDFCAVGFNVDDGTESEMLCGSEINAIPLFWVLTQDSIVFDFPEEAGNITPTEFHYPNLVYGVEHASGTGFSEVMTSKGIYRLDPDDDDLISIYDMPFSNLQAFPIDAELVGQDDILAGSGTNNIFYYIDDGFTNGNCQDDNCLLEVYLNPCVEGGNVKNGTQIQVNTLITDPDGDDVNINITLFEGSPIEQSLNYSNQSSGSYLSFLFQLGNQTTNTGTLTIDVWDRENPSKIETETYFFTVTPSGSEHGDNDCSINTTYIPPSVNNGTLSERDIIEGAFEDAQDMTGLTPILLFYFVIIVILGIIIFEGVKHHHDIKITMGLCYLFMGTAMAFAVSFEIIPVGHLIGLIVINVGAIALMIKTGFFGG